MKGRRNHKIDKPDKEKLEELQTVTKIMEEYGVSQDVAKRWLIEYDLFEHDRDSSGESSDTGKKLNDMDPDEFSEEYIPEKFRRETEKVGY